MASAFERQLKRLGLFGLSRLASSPGSPPTDADLATIRRILVVRPDERIGNAILIIPLLNAIKERFPDAHISLVMARRYWDLCEFIPSVDEFIPFDKRHYARNPVSFVAFIRRLRKVKYDLVFDASGDHSVSFTHLAITAYSGGRFRIGHDRGEAGQCYDVAVPVATIDRHETERHLDLLRSIARIDADPRPILKPTVDNGFAARLWNDLGWRSDRPTVIIHPGARGRKRWPSANFADLANRLVGLGYQLGVVWGPSDANAAEEMLNFASKSVKRIGVLSFRDFVSTVAMADVFFSGDCGPMHLAAATPPRKGVVTVFVIDKSARYGPLGPRDAAIVDDSIHQVVEEIVTRIKHLTSTDSQQPTLRSVVA